MMKPARLFMDNVLEHVSDPQKFFLLFKEDVNKFRIKVAAPLFCEEIKYCILLPRLLVHPVASKSVKYVGKGRDAAIDMNTFLVESLWIA